MSISGKLLRSVAIAAISIVFSVFSPVVHADLRLNLVATVDDRPAMKDVTWTVYRTDTDAKVMDANNHSTHVTLPAGDYRVVAELKENGTVTRRTRNFHLRTSDSSIVVPMD